MIGKWPLAKINDISERVAMGPFGSSIKVETFVSNGIPIISGQHLNGFKIDDKAGYNFITIEHADKLKHANVYRGDVIFTHAGNIGQVSFIPNNSLYQRYVISQRQFFLRPKQDKVLPEYLVAYFKSPEGQQKLLANTSSVGVPSISQPVSYLRNLEIPLPPLEEQRAIAHILCTLDDKIELNRRMNETLEQMARAIFKSWFVDFDPVRAKLDGLPPAGLDSATAALFPESLQISPLGHIPRGWTASNLAEIATNPRRGVQAKNIHPNTPYIALEHMPRRSIALGDWEDSAAVVSNKFAFNKNEILFGKLRPYFHKVGVAPFDGICSTDILVLAPKSPEWFGFLLGHASSDDLVQFTDLASTGTKMPRTNWSDIGSFRVAIPPRAVADIFTRTIRPIVEKIQFNIRQIRVLGDLRDNVLPKLLSGELSVSTKPN